MFKKQIVTMLVAAVFAAPVFAQEEGHGEATAAHGENYVGVSVSSLTAAPSSTGAAIIFGHRYSEHLAVDVAYEDSSALSNITEKTTAFSVAAVGIVPFNAGFEGYVRLGYASAHTRDDTGASANHGDITYGLGVEYRMNEKYSVGFGFDHVRVGDNVVIPRADENSYALTLIRSF